MGVSAYLAELDRPKPAPTVVPTIPWPDHITPAEMLSMVLGLRLLVVPQIVLEGDDFARTVALLDSFAQSIRQHEKHGRNWLAKHGPTLRSFLLVATPQFFKPAVAPVVSSPAVAEKEYEGQALMSLFVHVFPDAKRGAMQASKPMYTVDDLVGDD